MINSHKFKGTVISGISRSRDKNMRATYACWKDLKQRCFNPKHKKFVNWGGRGITVCDRWKDSFENFFADMGVKPSGPGRISIDRIDNDGNYEPGNCRWATQKQQVNNQRQRWRLITLDGISLTLPEWARRKGITRERLRDRLALGWSTERAITAPLIKQRTRNERGVFVCESH